MDIKMDYGNIFGGILQELPIDNPIAAKIIDLIDKFLVDFDVNILSKEKELVDYSSCTVLINIIEHDFVNGVILSDNLEFYKYIRSLEKIDVGSLEKIDVVLDDKQILILSWEYSSMKIFRYLLEKYWKPIYNTYTTFKEFDEKETDIFQELIHIHTIYKPSVILNLLEDFPNLIAFISRELIATHVTRVDYVRLKLKYRCDENDLEDLYEHVSVNYFKIFDFDNQLELFMNNYHIDLSNILNYWPEFILQLQFDRLIDIIKNHNSDSDIIQLISIMSKKYDHQLIKIRFRERYHEELEDKYFILSRFYSQMNHDH